MGKTASVLRWSLRVIALCFLVAPGTRRWFSRHEAVGIPIRVPSPTCSAEFMPEFVPLPFRLLSSHEVLVGDELHSREDAMRLLMRIRATRAGKTLFFDADDSLSFQEGVETLGAVHALLPDWRILVVTPRTRAVCEQFVRSRSGPAA
jgi:hypothetical protein